MLDKKALKSTYNRVARQWHEGHKSDDWWIEGTNELISRLPEGASILDVGCGGGTKSAYFLERGFAVTGIDFSQEQVAIAKESVPEAEFYVLDMYDLAALDGEFDCVFAQASLLHVPKKDVRRVLSELRSKVKSNGLMYVAVKEIREGQSEEEVKKEDRYDGMERFFSYYTLPELKRYFEGLDLEIVYEDVHLSGKTNWIQVIGRV